MNNALNTIKEIREERAATRYEYKEIEVKARKPRESLLVRISRAIEEAFAGAFVSDPHAMA